jgi:hypothetical protein
MLIDRIEEEIKEEELDCSYELDGDEEIEEGDGSIVSEQIGSQEDEDQMNVSFDS